MTTKRRCPKCNTLVKEADDYFCRRCGTTLNKRTGMPGELVSVQGTQKSLPQGKCGHTFLGSTCPICGENFF